MKIEPDKDKDNDCGPKPADVPGYHWSCEPDKDGQWRWVRVKAVKEKETENVKLIKKIAKGFDVTTKEGQKMWAATMTALLYLDADRRLLRTLFLDWLPNGIYWVIEKSVSLFLTRTFYGAAT